MDAGDELETMGVKVVRWQGDKAPAEDTIRALYRRESLEPYSWSNGPRDVYAPHSHSYHKVIYVVSGSITFGLPDTGESVTLNPGDRLELPPGTTHDAVVGSAGVVCLEAHC
jgi:quercetin dioxygenase-like cupin family protein